MSNLQRGMAQRQQKLALASHSEPADASYSAAGDLQSGRSFVSQNLTQEPHNNQQNVSTYSESKIKKEKEEAKEEVTDTNEAAGTTDIKNEDKTKAKKKLPQKMKRKKTKRNNNTENTNYPTRADWTLPSWKKEDKEGEGVIDIDICRLYNINTKQVMNLLIQSMLALTRAAWNYIHSETATPELWERLAQMQPHEILHIIQTLEEKNNGRRQADDT